VGLDFDPVLNAQDDDGRWIVINTLISQAHCFADLHTSMEDSDKRKIIVTAELQMSDGQWQLIDFHYPGDGDLIATLKALREDRAKNQ